MNRECQLWTFSYLGKFLLTPTVLNLKICCHSGLTPFFSDFRTNFRSISLFWLFFISSLIDKSTPTCLNVEARRTSRQVFPTRVVSSFSFSLWQGLHCCSSHGFLERISTLLCFLPVQYIILKLHFRRLSSHLLEGAVTSSYKNMLTKKIGVKVLNNFTIARSSSCSCPCRAASNSKMMSTLVVDRSGGAVVNFFFRSLNACWLSELCFANARNEFPVVSTQSEKAFDIVFVLRSRPVFNNFSFCWVGLFTTLWNKVAKKIPFLLK